MLNNNYQKAVFISSALHFYESKDEFFGDAWYCEDFKLLIQFGNLDCSAEFEFDFFVKEPHEDCKNAVTYHNHGHNCGNCSDNR